ncbi:hypothetical protein [Azospirillum ramasamyi]|uniref:hypothetical protein n=1 Tax=Azospirillum ramasamyi TaxID=682998 RepID=UPI0013A6E00A|nr:hypothetical protein [Azospirillum ramasamyi]
MTEDEMTEGIDEEDALRTGRPVTDHDPAGKARSDRSDPERMARKLASKAERARAALRSAPTPIAPKAAMQLARNLKPLIGALKKARPRHLKPLQDLTRRAGVSADGDEKRLSRFRPPKDGNEAAMRRLARDPKQYLALAETAAEMADLDVDRAVLDLVVNTPWSPSQTGVPSFDENTTGGYHRLLEQLRGVVAAISARAKLDWYLDETRRREAYRSGGGPEDDGWCLGHPSADQLDNAPSVPLLFNEIGRMACEARDESGGWREVDLVMLERVHFGIAKLKGDQVPTGYFMLAPWYGVVERGRSLDDARCLLRYGIPSVRDDEIMDDFQTSEGGPWVRVTVRVPAGKSLPTGPYGRFPEDDPFGFEDAGFVERLSLSGIERALGGSVFHVIGTWGDRADRPEPGFTEAPPGTAAAHVEAGLVFGYAHPPEKAFTVRGALEDSAVHHLATFKAFMARQMELADGRAQQAIQDFRDGPDRMRTGCFDDVDIPLQTETVEE